MLLLCPARSLVQRCPHPARPLGVCGPFFVRSVLKKMRTLIHKKNAVIFIHLISSKLYIERNNNKKLCKIKKKKNIPCPRNTVERKKKKSCSYESEKKPVRFILLTFFDRMMIFLLNCDGRSKCIFARKNLALTEFGITMERNC